MIHATLRRDLAASDYATAYTLQKPTTPRQWWSHATLRVYLGDTDGYREICAHMPEQLTEEKYFGYENELSRTCTLVPVPGLDLAWATRMAGKAVARQSSDPWNHHAPGLAYSRAGQYERSIEELRRSLQVAPGWLQGNLNHSALAMAHYRLGRTQEVREALGTAGQVIDKWWRDLLVSERSVPPAGYWQEWLESLLFYREARALIEGRTPSNGELLMTKTTHGRCGNVIMELCWTSN